MRHITTLFFLLATLGLISSLMIPTSCAFFKHDIDLGPTPLQLPGSSGGVSQEALRVIHLEDPPGVQGVRQEAFRVVHLEDPLAIQEVRLGVPQEAPPGALRAAQAVSGSSDGERTTSGSGSSSSSASYSGSMGGVGQSSNIGGGTTASSGKSERPMVNVNEYTLRVAAGLVTAVGALL